MGFPVKHQPYIKNSVGVNHIEEKIVFIKMKIRPVLTIKTAQITQKWKAKLYEIRKKARFWGVLVTMATFQAYRHPKQHMFLAPKEGGGVFCPKNSREGGICYCKYTKVRC